MPNLKKRRRQDISDPVIAASLTGDDSIESCLAEMAGSAIAASLAVPAATTTAQISRSTASVSADAVQHLESIKDLLFDPTLVTTTVRSREQSEQIATWNRAMHLWQTSNTYTPGLLPSFDVEVTRHFKVQSLSSYLLEACQELKMPAFERWLIDSKLEERDHHVSFSDPVLSGSVTLEFDSSQRLVEEIRETGTSRADAKKIVQDLCRRTNTAVNEIAQQQTLHAGRAPLKKGDRIDLEGHEPVYTLVYHRKRWKKPFCIKLNSSHYDKLRAMFTRVHGETLRFSSGKPTKLTHAFHLLLMVLLLRYSALSGGQLLLDLRGGGMQGAVHGQVFGVLREMFPNGPLLECFASPLNSYLPSFGSAFPKDLDWHFGSIGNFLDEKITEGCCEANPPFSPGMMSAMAARIEYNLTQADERKGMLTFVVIVPSAGDDKVSQRAAAKRFGGISLQKMTTSSSCRLHILLSAKEHGYVEGAQHMRPTRYKESLYDTSVIVLQSEQARRHALDKGLLDEKIREAFVSRHREEVERRKQSEGEGESDASESS